MKIPRNLKGSDLVQTLCKTWDYKIVNQEGIHIILETETPAHHRLCVPDHNPLRVGTLNSILAAVSRHKGIAKQDILNS
ncbi:type II toxin-antitoxin system HicA family toxin [Dolichospermum sp. UHCC 0259]|uniref:type II toxin-antitoxin system HicA family toxin n=1 Tax=Dolichospermum sp. UHCC 0259 TaxID=2590010 RepID=UPI001444B7B9|nr:type II toxin-antitoxin system HicA family toxin [Dolichospermum sp. UHCC 0259]MTJ50335.1 type II toxin-antitoxin system HicA family toxin [Dolichospermum sp. UHCC 0259]